MKAFSMGPAVFLVALGAAFSLLGQGLLPHDPILITSDADFTLENGVLSGSGTLDDPYVIAGWTIQTETGFGIRVQGTTAYFVIRDCRFEGRRLHGTGILFREVSGACVQGCVFVGLETGVFLYQTSEAWVKEGVFLECRRGVEAIESGEAIVAHCAFEEARERGVFLWRSHAATVVGNVFIGCHNGIYMDSCHRGRLKENHVGGADRGIFLWDSFDCTVVGNVLRGCDLGIGVVHTSTDNTLFHNVFFANSRPATCDEPDNRWDGGYPVGGNFWGGVPSVDERSGSQQDQPGSDGVSDRPLQIPVGGSVDRYPLMWPPVPKDEEEVGLSKVEKGRPL